MLSHEENKIFTRVGPATPMGDTLRRYWWPIHFSEQVTKEPLRVRLLGEDFVLFRDGASRPGMLDLQCPHRLTSLEFGRVEDKGIRCCYHGWLFDVDGRCLEQPAEHPDSTYKDRVTTGAYSARDLGGFVFVYIGPAPAPRLPVYDVLAREDGSRVVGCDEDYCNWLQKAENGADFSHLPFLHASVYPHMAMKTPLGYDYPEEDYGFKCVLRMPELPPRVAHMVMPSHSRISTTPRKDDLPSYGMRLRVPIDDTLTYSFWIRFHPKPDAPFEQETRGFSGKPKGTYAREQDDYWNIPSAEQDRVAQESQGVITDRSREHLAESDAGVILLRHKLRDAMDAVAAGKDPQGVVRGGVEGEVIEFESTLPEDEYVNA